MSAGDPTRVCTWRCSCGFDRKMAVPLVAQIEITCEHCGQWVRFMIEADGTLQWGSSIPGMSLTITHPVRPVEKAVEKVPELPARSVWDRINDDEDDDPV